MSHKFHSCDTFAKNVANIALVQKNQSETKLKFLISFLTRGNNKQPSIDCVLWSLNSFFCRLIIKRIKMRRKNTKRSICGEGGILRLFFLLFSKF